MTQKVLVCSVWTTCDLLISLLRRWLTSTPLYLVREGVKLFFTLSTQSRVNDKYVIARDTGNCFEENVFHALHKYVYEFKAILQYGSALSDNFTELRGLFLVPL